MNNLLKNSCVSAFSIFLCLVMLQLSYAESPSGYAEWKAMQQAQDQQLKKPKEAAKPSTQGTNHPNYYLSRPSTGAASVQDRVNLNTATAEQLQTLSGIGQKKAEAIVAYRQKNGRFKSIDDIQLVKGVGPALFAKNKAKLSL